MRVEDFERLSYEEGLQACAENGYTDYRVFANGRDAAVSRMGFNYAIFSDLTRWGYGDRWCFSSYAMASHALAAWDGEGDPPFGWHRHPDSGRRRPDGDPAREYINY